MNLKHLTQSKERVIVVFFLAIFALFNIATACHTNYPWLDEVAYGDPASTWFFGGGFQSTLWPDSGKVFWVGNVPLHQFLLCLWMKIFGFSAYTVRGASMIYYVIATGLLWHTLRRGEFLRNASTRFVFILTALGATGCVAVYRNGRYDALGVILVSIAVAAACKPRRSLGADAVLFLSAALLPWAGLQLLPFFGISTLCYLAVLKRDGIRVFLAANLGMTFGIASLLSFYFAIGRLTAFREALNVQKKVWSDFQLAVFMNPTSLALLLLGIGFVIAFRHRDAAGASPLQRRAGFGLITLGVLAPVVMHAVCKYTIYYSWMAVLPCAAGVLFFWERCENRRWRAAVLAVLALSILPGYPRRLFNIAFSNTHERQNQVDAFVRGHLNSGDSTLLSMEGCCLAGYYSVKSLVKTTVIDAQDTVDPETARAITTVLVNKPNLEQEFQRRLGGSWRMAGELCWGAGGSSHTHWRAILFGRVPGEFFIYKRQPSLPAHP